jgi:hypothetical protein
MTFETAAGSPELSIGQDTLPVLRRIVRREVGRNCRFPASQSADHESTRRLIIRVAGRKVMAHGRNRPDGRFRKYLCRGLGRTIEPAIAGGRRPLPPTCPLPPRCACSQPGTRHVLKAAVGRRRRPRRLPLTGPQPKRGERTHAATAWSPCLPSRFLARRPLRTTPAIPADRPDLPFPDHCFKKARLFRRSLNDMADSRPRPVWPRAAAKSLGMPA